MWGTFGLARDPSHVHRSLQRVSILRRSPRGGDAVPPTRVLSGLQDRRVGPVARERPARRPSRSCQSRERPDSSLHRSAQARRDPMRATRSRFDDRRGVFTVDDGIDGTDSNPTPEQCEAITVGREKDYFDVPRGTSLQSIADSLGTSDTAASYRFRRGLKTLVEESVDSNEGAESVDQSVQRNGHRSPLVSPRRESRSADRPRPEWPRRRLPPGRRSRTGRRRRPPACGS